MVTLEKAERIVKIISAIAIPIVIGGFGYIIDMSVSQQTLAKEYVEIGLNILNEESVAPELKDWALQLINKNAPLINGFSIVKG